MQRLLSKVHSRDKSISLFLLRSFLYSLSLCYRLGAAIHSGSISLKQRLMSSGKRLPKNLHVISIGNIVAGGTGKTPLTILIARYLVDQHLSLAILSRGYKSKLEKDPNGPFLISKGQGPIYDASVCGDEPYLIASKVPQALFYVGRDRRKAAHLAQQNKTDVVLLDDGMQYHKLRRNTEIVVMDSLDPFGKNYFLPRGFLRQHPKKLSKADLIVLNHVQDRTHFDAVCRQIAQWSPAPIVGVKAEYQGCYSLEKRELVELKGKKIIAFCGIAKPTHFFNLLKEQGAHIVDSFSLEDHQQVSEHMWHQIHEQAYKLGVDCIVCTEKDAVKLNHHQSPLTAWVSIELKVCYNESLFKKFLDEKLSKIGKFNF